MKTPRHTGAIAHPIKKNSFPKTFLSTKTTYLVQPKDPKFKIILQSTTLPHRLGSKNSRFSLTNRHNNPLLTHMTPHIAHITHLSWQGHHRFPHWLSTMPTHWSMFQKLCPHRTPHHSQEPTIFGSMNASDGFHAIFKTLWLMYNSILMTLFPKIKQINSLFNKHTPILTRKLPCKPKSTLFSATVPGPW